MSIDPWCHKRIISDCGRTFTRALKRMKWTVTVFCNPVVSLLMTLFLLSLTIHCVEAEAAKPEKIFRHERLPEKLSRIDLENDEIQRALEELRRRIPEYTGYLLLDVVFEFFKLICVSLLRLLGQQQQQHQITDSQLPN